MREGVIKDDTAVSDMNLPLHGGAVDWVLGRLAEPECVHGRW